MSMKNHIHNHACTLIMMMCTFAVFGQDSVVKKQEVTPKVIFKVTKNTALEKFDKDLVITSEERLQIKKNRYKDYLLKKSILDTMNLSERKKKKLLKDLRFKPFSEQLSKAFVNIKFEDDN